MNNEYFEYCVMKTFYKIVLCTLSLCTILASCQKQDNPFNVDGDCRIDSLVLDEIYPGVVEQRLRPLKALR